ncbi:MAG: efflux RND transporter periplasmic adaptor subunit [Myxococcales bacterium]|jgi:Cu(I)/Ag(I) efflux system membrane fusion protein|nr:efflux RND transporter periplasmic adaptor subunit [Myxococcales bacterium]
MTAMAKTWIVILGVIGVVGAGASVQYARKGWPFSSAGERAAGSRAPSHTEGHEPQAGGHPSHAGHTQAPTGYAPITIEPAQAAALHLSTALVEEREFTRTIRTVGTIVLDETRTAHVHVKVRGWIDRIFINFVGQKVRAGEPLCSIYSQDIYSAELEYLSILEGASTRPESDPLLTAARRRLSLWDVPKTEIERLEKTRQVNRTFPLLAPRAGTVVAKQALQGMAVDPAVELYTLSDLSTVWVLADVYETDVPYVHIGDKAQLAIEGRQASLDASVSFLSPTIDEPSRTRKVRFILPNSQGLLLPGAFVNVTMEAPLGEGLAVPESAVIRTGARSIVFVVHGEGTVHIEPREVTLGPLVGDRYRIERGLKAMEKVATGAQFLLDSESRLRATSAPGGGHAH